MPIAVDMDNNHTLYDHGKTRVVINIFLNNILLLLFAIGLVTNSKLYYL